MNTKHTFWTLCDQYDKIEVPIIQRDYAQGRETDEVKRLRIKFIDNFLIKSLLENKKVELDFVYGSILESDGDDKKKIFIPLDGQQRLTTLFLLHFFIALKENRLHEIREVLKKFNYETRPSAHDFCKKITTKFEIENISNIKFEIENSEWFNDNWNHDPTVVGMINMLDTFSKNDLLVNSENDLLDKLLDTQNLLISFYFTPLDEFGLTENLYIRMNARGKMLTDFENFKSEFFKIINYNHELLDIVKLKIEYDWVDNLWEFRGNSSFVIDNPFMQYLSFITEMLYFKQGQLRNVDIYQNFLDFKLLNDIYKNEDNLKFLIFSLDFIDTIKDHNQINILWKEKTTLKDLLREVIEKKRENETNELYILFSAINYFYQGKEQKNLYDFLRVVRNLIHNTNDNSRREWPRLLNSLNNLISDKNVYELLLNLDDKALIGFEVNQRNEEIFKAKLFSQIPNSKDFILSMEDNSNFEGNISNLLKSIYATTEDFTDISFEMIDISILKVDKIKATYKAYLEISKNDFCAIWGDLLITNLYKQTSDSRLNYSAGYKKHPSIIMFAKAYSDEIETLTLNEYLSQIQKKFVCKIAEKNSFLNTVNEVKIQLYLYYLMHKRINNKEYDSFFKHDNYNFGWLSQKSGYKSLFTNGIDGCQYFQNSNPIFQVYNQQFRYNLGINKNYTLDVEIEPINQNLFNELVAWSRQ
jgi:hypothetical protein